MSEETGSLTSTSTDPPSQGGQQGQEQQKAQHSSSSSSLQENGVIINQENNKNEKNGSRFVDDVKTTAMFEPRAKTTVCVLKEPLFPKSRQLAIQVNNSRSMSFVDKVTRNGNGKNALRVEIPLKTANGNVLVMIVVDYQQKMKAISYNQENGTVTCSDGALSTICKDAGGLATLDAEEVKVIDDLLAKYLETLLWGPETKSAEGEIKKDCTCLFVPNILFFILLQIFGRNWKSVTKISTSLPLRLINRMRISRS